VNKCIIFLAVCFLVSCTSNTGNVVVDVAETSNKLFVEPDSVKDKQQEFVEKLKLTGKNPNKRALYEEYIDVLGANGILDGIDAVYERCHGQAHDLGKVVFAKVSDISTGLRICSDRCYTGCMHGVLMEAFKEAQDDEDGHIDVMKLKEMLNDICLNNEEMKASYGPGECAHGVGHAMMFLSGYGIQEALDACAGFDNQKMDYYCTDGAYMEYAVERESEDQDKSLFYPCDTFAYPATCMRTKVGLVGKQLDKVGADLVKECEKLEGKFRLGCFHGIGTSHAKILALEKMRINELCSQGSSEEQVACIEGAVEFMGKYFPDDVQKTCDQLADAQKEICVAAGQHKLYSMEKDLSLYLR